MDLLKQQLYLRAQIVQAVSACSPVPNQPQRGSETKVAVYLKLIHDLHSTLRYMFQCFEMRSPLLSTPEKVLAANPKLDPILIKIATYLMVPTERASLELKFFSLANSSDELITILTNVYNAFLQYPPSSRPIDTGSSTVTAVKEAVLGWSTFARSSLPLAEAAIIFDSRTAGYVGAPLCRFWQSRVLNAITVSPEQGQQEWLAIVSDTLATDLDATMLSWVAFVRAEASYTFPGSHSLVVNESVMTDQTIHRPNELFKLISPVHVDRKGADFIYTARRELCLLRLDPNTPLALQPAPAARKMLRLVRKALICEDPVKRKDFYEHWIRSEWDAPSILIEASDIRQIVRHLDPNLAVTHISDTVLRVLVIDNRGLKSVCARARGLARTTLVHVGPMLADAAANDLLEVRLSLAKSLQTVELVRAELSSYDTTLGLVFDHSRMVGTDVKTFERPRRLWDLVFNVTIESTYSTQPWIAVSHSWAQADGHCLGAVNERANIIPWATRADLNHVRTACLRAGYSMAWMDKVCLRQRGIDGFDSAIRRLEWVTDIPFIDVAYRNAAKVLVYLEGAGRPLQYKTTFRAGKSWLFRKWTAQETPSGVGLVLGSGDRCIDGEFFGLCKDITVEWHRKQHHNIEPNADVCSKCYDIRKRLDAVQSLRNIPKETMEAERLRCVWEVMQGRAAGTDADHAFSLLSLLNVRKRPRYDPRYTRAQAATLVRNSLVPNVRDILQAKENGDWFEGMFLTRFQSIDDKLDMLLAAFLPITVTGDHKGQCNLQGALSARVSIQTCINGNYLEILKSSTGETRLCACHRFDRKLVVGPQDVYGDFFIWHGIGACCAAVFSEMAREPDVKVFDKATHLLLSGNRMHCVFLQSSESSGKGIDTYQIIQSQGVLTYSTTVTWMFKAPQMQNQRHRCEILNVD